MLLNARRVFDEDGSASAILLAIEDVTRRREADREKDDLLQAKEILLQEMQHRVANSLQIIASILLLKARTVQSEETRRHLQDAHQRVMSVATVQAAAARLRAKRKDRDRALSHQAVRQSCSLDGRRTPGALDQGASELRRRDIQRSRESRTDRDGVGDQRLEARLPGRSGGRNPGQLRRAEIPAGGFRFPTMDRGRKEAAGEAAHIGLGTSIVEALAHQLNATVQKTSGADGTTVAITAPAASDGSEA